MNLPNLLAFVLLVAALAFFLFGLLLAAGPTFFNAELMVPELQPSADLPLEVRPIAEELRGSGAWILGCGVVFLFWIPAALLAASGGSIFWWIGRRRPTWTRKEAVLGLRAAGLLSFLVATFFVLWCGVLIFQASAMPPIDERTGNPLRANVYGAAALSVILALLAATFGAGLVGSTFMKPRQET